MTDVLVVRKQGVRHCAMSQHRAYERLHAPWQQDLDIAWRHAIGTISTDTIDQIKMTYFTVIYAVRFLILLKCLIVKMFDC